MCNAIAILSDGTLAKPAPLRSAFNPALCAAWLAFLVIAAVLPAAIHADDSLSQNESTELAARTAAYFDPDRPGEGIFVEILPDGRALVYVFSYGPKHPAILDSSVNEPSQVWMLGVGRHTELGIEVSDLLMPTGGRFGTAFDPDEVEYAHFGRLDFRYPTCGSSTERGWLEIWNTEQLFPESLNSYNYVELSQVLDCNTGIGSQHSHVSGSWFDATRPGEGFIVEVLKDDNAIVQWMTYDSEGNQMWIQGIGGFDQGGNLLRVDNLQTFGGTYWASDFNAAEIAATPFGSLTINFWNCDFADLSFESPTFGSGTYSLERITTPLHINDAGVGCWDY